ncbi:MAG: GNAT family N-acetyltransferase [Bacteroidota bacterium]
MALKEIMYESPEYDQMIQLRLDILRKPIGLSFTIDELKNEKNDILLGAFEEDHILACCVLTPENENSIQLRQMAVQNNIQGKGVGATLLRFAENVARDRGYSYMMMHARDSAVRFYEKHGYQVDGESFFEVTIPHYKMVKKIK